MLAKCATKSLTRLQLFQVRAAECHGPSGDVPLPAEGERCGPMENGPFPPDSMEEDLPRHRPASNHQLLHPALGKKTTLILRSMDTNAQWGDLFAQWGMY